MAQKKIPMHFGEDSVKKVQDIARWQGIENLETLYGGFTKIVRFCIAYTHSKLPQEERGIVDLKDGEIDAFFATLKNLRKERKQFESQQNQQ